jgi:hypothetical protein
MKPTIRTVPAPPKPTPPWDQDGAAKIQTAISGSSIAAQLSNIQDLIGVQDQELAAFRELRCFARRLAGMPQEPDDDAPISSCESLGECAARLRGQMEQRRALLDGIRVALGAA